MNRSASAARLTADARNGDPIRDKTKLRMRRWSCGARNIEGSVRRVLCLAGGVIYKYSSIINSLSRAVMSFCKLVMGNLRLT
jgi:hypothetical protein